MPTIGVDHEEPLSGSEFKEGYQELKIIFVGRLVLLKGVHLLLDSLAEAALKNVTLTIVGDGPEREFLEAKTFKLGLQEQVRFIGQVPKDRLPELYASHHVVAGPSLYESGGYMVLEGFQQKRPAIVIDVGGLALSVDESCGIKVPQGSAKAVISGLAEAISHYHKHPEKIQLHGEAGFIKLKNCYTWDEKGKVMNDVYHSATKTSRQT